ncbi:MAG: hypothetical protein R3F21_23250 [Myxococcota bacterium]
MASGSIHGARSSKVLASDVSAPALSPSFLLSIARRLARLCEGIAYSSVLAALVGGAMTWAVGQALASPRVAHDAALVACGAFLVYGLDRLRDLDRDRLSAPRRTAFIVRHRSQLANAAGVAGLVLCVLFAAAPGPKIALCVAVGAVGFLHRRLKQAVGFKIAYVAAAWTVACVGLPWLGRSEPGQAAAGELGWSLLFVGTAVTANLIASNLREGKRIAPGWPPGRMLLAARGIAITSASLAGFAPESVAPLAWIPAAEVLALGFFRGSERYGHLAVDGALLIGALAAVAHASA